MREERTPDNADRESGRYTFFFQIANDGRRRACCVKVGAANIHEASVLFRQRWSVIEGMARDGIKAGTVDDGIITIAMP